MSQFELARNVWIEVGLAQRIIRDAVRQVRALELRSEPALWDTGEYWLGLLADDPSWAHVETMFRQLVGTLEEDAAEIQEQSRD